MTEAAQRFAVFDDPGIAASFVRACRADTREATLAIDGIHCAACSLAIEKGLGSLDGVTAIEVNPATRLANLSWSPARVRFSELMAAIAELGFEPHPLRQDTRARLNVAEYRAALKRLIVAGLGMMQVMTYAVATYAGAFDGISADYLKFFRLLSLLVATPVVLYSAAPFFHAAARDLSQRRVGMDVPVALAIGIAYAASVGIVFLGNLGSEIYFDSVVMFTFFLSVGRFAEMIARHRTLAATEALGSSLPDTAMRIVGGQHEGWPAEHVPLTVLSPGDRVLVRPGETIPADGTVVWGRSDTDESLLTGESKPRRRGIGDAVIGGSLNVSGPIHVAVTHTGADTMLSGIARLLERAQAERPRMARLADAVARWFVAGVIGVAAAVCLAWLAIDPSRALTVTLSVLVVTCPCALSLATPAALTAATGFLSRHGLLVTRGRAVEVLARADTLLLDKTGTLTQGRLEVTGVEVLDENLTRQDCLGIAAALETGSAHPVAAAFADAGGSHAATKIETFPGQGIEGEVDGRLFRVGTRGFAAGLTPIEALCGEDAPVSSTQTQVFLGGDTGLVAMFTLGDALRPEAAGTMTALRERGLDLAMLSGDTRGPVAAVAGALGIDDFAATQLPEQKLQQLKRRRAGGRVIAMLGDGINDAPVLAGADVSIAMGSGSMLAQASADLILLGGSLEPLVTGIDRARATIRIVRQNMIWAICYNVVALPLAAAGMVAPWMAAVGMSASSLVVVLNALRLGREGKP